MTTLTRLTGLILTLACLLAGYACTPPPQQIHTSAIVPAPDTFQAGNGYLQLEGPFTVALETPGLEDALRLLHEMAPFGEWQTVQQQALLQLTITDTLGEEAYTVAVEHNIRVAGGSYTAVAWGIISVLQMLEYESSGYRLPKCYLADAPDMRYRGFMLDLAREWHELPTVKLLIDLCAWYKVRYMQLHLSDNESFTFPSQAFPALATPGRHYPLDSLRALVAYASARGVILVPELDGPGHTAAMRRAMPGLFGPPDLGIINIADDKTVRAMETLIGEMMDVFHTSPYFHIGADEVWLEPFSKQAATVRKIKESGLEDAHDLYLRYIVQMHAFVRSRGKQTLVWESFDQNGSDRVKVPRDIRVIAWETLYQRPDSLVKNGYDIINASWKPLYVTPGRRWSTERIYGWNPWRWENFWEVTPAFHHPIQLDTTAPVWGAQLCAWEMTEAMELPLIRHRLPALAERVWAPERKGNIAAFRQRMRRADSLFEKLTFPVADHSTHLIDDSASYDAGVRSFYDTAFISMRPVFPGYQLRFTSDGSVPDAQSPLLPEKWPLYASAELRFGLFKDDVMKGYRIVRYSKRPFSLHLTGHLPIGEDVDRRRPEIFFNDTFRIEATAHLAGGEIRYTTDGSEAGPASTLYTGSIRLDSSVTFHIRYFNSAGEPSGKQLEYRFLKKEGM